MKLRIVLMVSLIVGTSLWTIAEEPTHENSPRLSNNDLDYLGTLTRRANQDLSDRNEFETQSDTYRTQLISHVFVLAMQQYSFVPAYRDLYQKTMSRFIERMIHEAPDSEDSKVMVALYQMLYRNTGGFEITSSGKRVLPATLTHEMKKMIENPWDRKAFGYPLLAQVDFPNVLVRQAVWDDASETLLFTLEPIGDVPVFTSFVIENIYTNYLAILEQDGEYLAAIDEHAQVAGANTRNLDPGQIEIKTTLTGLTKFTLKPMN